MGDAKGFLQKKRHTGVQCCRKAVVLGWLLPAATAAGTGSGPMLHAAGAVLKRYRQKVRSRNVPNNRSLASNWWACHTLKEGKALLARDFIPIENTTCYWRSFKVIEGVVCACDAEEKADGTYESPIWCGLIPAHSTIASAKRSAAKSAYDMECV
jgi:hypothetical protein